LSNSTWTRGELQNASRTNLPTHRWVATFLSRQKELTLRKTNAIKRTRTAESRKDVSTFFGNFLVSMEGVKPENLWNYSETCFRDDIDTVP